MTAGERLMRVHNGTVRLVGDRLVWRSKSGELVYRCTPLESVAILAIPQLLVRNGCFNKQVVLPGSYIAFNAQHPSQATYGCHLRFSRLCADWHNSAIGYGQLETLQKWLTDALGTAVLQKRLAQVRMPGLPARS